MPKGIGYGGRRKMTSLKAPGVRKPAAKKMTPAKKVAKKATSSSTRTSKRTSSSSSSSNGGWSIVGRDKRYGMIGTGGSPFGKRKR